MEKKKAVTKKKAGSTKANKTVAKKTEAVAAPAINEATLGYTVGEYMGYPHYKCSSCAFDVVNHEWKMLRHIRTTHVPQQAPPVSPAVLATDKQGDEGSSVVPAVQDDSVVNLELEEVDSYIDDQGVEHKSFTIKE